MTECGACQSPLPADTAHCSACGAGVAHADELRSLAAAPVAAIDPAELTDAGVLGAAESGTARTRQALGEPAGDADPAEPSGPAGWAGQRRHARWPGMLLAAVGLVLIAAGGYSAYRGAHGLRPGAAPTSRTTPPTTPPTPTPTPTATPTAGEPPLVTVAPALRNQPDVAEIVSTLTTYFTAINDRDYQAYRSVLVGADARAGDEQDFLTRFRSTRDSEIWVVGIRRDLDEVFATVSFRSHQDPRDSPDLVSDCLSWVVTYQMTRVDGQFKIDLVRNFALTHRPC